MAKTYTPFSRNVAADLAAKVTAKGVTIPSNLVLSVDLTLEQAGYDKIVKNPLWMQKVVDATKGPLAKGIAVIAGEIDAGKGLDAKALQKRVEALGNTLAKELATEVEEALERFVKDKTEYKIYKVKAVGKIVLGAIGIAGSAAAAVLSGGAASPVAIIAFTRSGIAVAQNVAKMALDAEKVQRLIRADFAVLYKVMKDNKDDDKLKGLKEVGLNTFASVLGIETPSIANCDGRIELYKNKITGLKREADKLSKGIYKLMDLNEDLAKKVASIKSDDPKIKKAKANLVTGEKTLDEVLTQVSRIGERVEAAEGHHKTYSEALEAMKEGLPSWTKYVSTVASLVIDLGMGIGDASSAVEKGLAALQSVVATAADQIVEKA